MQRKLTESLEDYLEAISELIAIEGHAHSKEIAARLHVKMPSVTGALRQLEKMGLIHYNTHYPVQLTAAGTVIANEVRHRHRILKKFFAEILGLSPEKASETACHLEHVVDSETIQRFVLFSEAIESREDARQLQRYLTEAMSRPDCCVLSRLDPGDTCTFAAYGRNIGAGHPYRFRENDPLSVQSISLDRSVIRVLHGNGFCDVPLPDAENLWVRRTGGENAPVRL